MPNRQFSIVSYLDENSTNEVAKLQKLMSKETASQACLEHWAPHITIGDGIVVSSIKELEILEFEMAKLASNMDKLILRVASAGGTDSRKGGFDEVTTPYALWLDVEVSPGLEELRQAVQRAVICYDKWFTMKDPYAPHVTVAFRDLAEAGYLYGKELLAEYDTSHLKLSLNSFSLVERLKDSDKEFITFAF